jgi:hypothetical protein
LESYNFEKQIIFQMGRRAVQPLLFLFLLMPFFALYGQQKKSEWVLAKDKNGIQVFTRHVQSTKIKEYKATTILNTTPEKLLPLLTKASNYKQWMSGLKSAKTIRREGDSVYYTWSRLAIPWPFQDRDEVTRSVVIKDRIPGSCLIKSKIVKGVVPKKKGLVRMTKGHGYWWLQQLPGGKTKVVFQFLADPAGSLPASIVNLFIVDSPYKSLMNLKQRIKK